MLDFLINEAKDGYLTRKKDRQWVNFLPKFNNFMTLSFIISNLQSYLQRLNEIGVIRNVLLKQYCKKTSFVSLTSHRYIVLKLHEVAVTHFSRF